MWSGLWRPLGCSKSAYEHRGIMNLSCPGKPTDNTFIETSNGSLRDECLNIHRFLSLVKAREKLECWRMGYNHERMCSSLNNMTPDKTIRSLRKDEHLKLCTKLLLFLYLDSNACYS
ncbi:transposase [Raoultella ornithinolytica]|uniref:integrase core domain-containing protein n=1 Tax=Raoultella ornithinolytica TaxID=54291 RepID=UPI0012653624|nr:transposase [Raoultella ornithinolytica]